MMPLPSLLLFMLLRHFILIPTPCEAVVYYVKPTEPPNSDCLGQPCQTLDYYFHNKDKHLSSDKVNVTMLLLHGEHKLTDGEECSIEDLETFEMTGIEAAHQVVVYLPSISDSIQLKNVFWTFNVQTLTKKKKKK